MEVWKLAKEQAKKVFELCSREPFSKDFTLKKQMNDSSGSVMDNIAEGYERSGNGEFVYFLGVAKGSNGELRSQYYRVLDRKYFTQEEFNTFYAESENIGKQLGDFMDYLQQSPYKGPRFNKNKDNRKKKP
ncbi:MAG TPA: four helix bundle protein [Chitinophagaceae bacterium]|nr:four helix bundle protein [Chitinophagaceae bacterium]